MQEVVIAGFTKNEGTGKSFSALVLGIYKNGHLEFAGKVGTGFSDKLQKEMMGQFKLLITDKSPFNYEVDVDKPTRFCPKRMGAKPTWLKPNRFAKLALQKSPVMVFSGKHPSKVCVRIKVQRMLF